MSATAHSDEERIAGYANPDMLVTTDWVAARTATDGGAIVESDEDVLLYETGHIPGAVKIDWHTELQDPVTRDYVDGATFAELMRRKGIDRDDTVVFYGDKSNWWAAYALWVFTLFGHPDVRLMDGGRAKWTAEERELTTARPEPGRSDYPIVERDDAPFRAFRDDVEARMGGDAPLVDVRSPEEFRGEKLHMPDYPQEGALRGGHIPGAKNVPWKQAVADDGTFKPVDELRRIYADQQGLGQRDDVVAYCRIGERSAHTWFVLHHLLGYPHVRNYDGSWTEWGNMVRAPIEQGDPAA